MKTVFRALLALGLILAVVCLPERLCRLLNQDELTDEMYRRREAYYTGVIELWQIDCFEGGTGSRTQWLKNAVGAFEKKHNGVFINVNSVSPLLAEQLLDSGDRQADMISFGAGITVDRAKLESLEAQTDTLFPFLGPVCFSQAIPWCMGAYCVIGETENWGKDGFTDKRGAVYSLGIAPKAGYDPFQALTRADLTRELSFRQGTAQEMFDLYAGGRVRSLVGTQRDLYRVLARQNRGAMREGAVTFLEEYNDLFQFIGIFHTQDEKKMSMMQTFVSFLLEKEQQDALGEIGMFPVRNDAAPVYTSADMQEVWEKLRQAAPRCVSSLWTS